jgi:signal transduction histidine kinase
MLIILLSLGIISYFSVNNSIKSSLDTRLTLATIVSRYFDYMLESNLTRLYDISIAGIVDFEDDDWEPEKTAIKTAYQYSIFTDRIFILDNGGNVVLDYPHQQREGVNLLSIPYVSKTIHEGKPVISDVYTVEETSKKIIFALVPLKNKNGDMIGVAGGEINPTNYLFTRIIKSIPLEPSTFIELIDSHGIVIASNESTRILTRTDHNEFLGNLIHKKESSVATCHRCHVEDNTQEERTEDILAFAPLSVAPWGITVREPQDIVFAPSTQLKRRFAILSLIAIGTALVLAIGLSRSIVRPVQVLSAAAHRIGKGNLHEPVEIESTEEIGILARTFDNMRIKLAESLQSVQRQNIVLEQRVLDRTKDLAASREKLSKLLKRVITAEEEERKRVARELHDDTSQSLNAILMSLDALSLSIPPDNPVLDRLKKLRENCLTSLHGLHQMIKDLRPPVLDDLGLESAIRWVLEKHLGEKGIEHSLTTGMSCRDIEARSQSYLDCGKIELILFRVVQEAIINIEKHAHPKHVAVSLDSQEGQIEVKITDDGIGFDAESIATVAKNGREIGGYGILGMQERVALLNGEMTIRSNPGEGTEIRVTVPL